VDQRTVYDCDHVISWSPTRSAVDKIEAVFATLGQRRASALLVNTDPFFLARRAQFVSPAARHGVPAIYAQREFGQQLVPEARLAKRIRRNENLIAAVMAHHPALTRQGRSRRYLTGKEIERLMDCARRHGRYGHRDATMILVAYRHGLRASEVCDLQWHQIELAEGRLHVRRVKNGTPSVHPIRGDEMRALRKLRREHL
jgi:integrase